MVCHFTAFVAASVMLRINGVSLIFLHLLPLPSFYEQIMSRFPAFVAATIILRTNGVAFSCFFPLVSLLYMSMSHFIF
jgi:hypothetical protein